MVVVRALVIIFHCTATFVLGEVQSLSNIGS